MVLVTYHARLLRAATIFAAATAGGTGGKCYKHYYKQAPFYFVWHGFVFLDSAVNYNFTISGKYRQQML
jgi:uncharacterized membrane protein YjjB (DUF3815 family)